MALNAYLTIVGATQGKIEGNSKAAGREGQIEVFGWDHEIVVPTGKSETARQHTPMQLTKAVDRTTGLLTNVLVNNEDLKSWKLDCYKPKPDGSEDLVYTISLEGAQIADVRLEQLNNKYPENINHEIREHISFTYQKITWTWVDGNVTAEDDWETPAV